MGALKNIWSDDFNKALILALIVLGFALLLWPQQAETTTDSGYTFFYLDTCPHCHEQMEFHEQLLTDYPDLDINAVDVSTRDSQSLYMQLLTELDEPPESIQTPVTIINGTVIKGFDTAETTGEQIRAALDGEEVVAGPIECSTESDCNAPLAMSIWGYDFSVNPMDYSLPVLALLLGFVDGFNPCAMWVLVYLISLVVMLQDKRRAWLLIGIFLAASGILYFLFLTAWLNVFLLIGFLRPVQILVGLFALGAGIISLRDWWRTKGAVVCGVGDAKSKKKTMHRAKDLINAPLTIASIFGMIILAFIINSIEFVCSFGIPAVFSEVLAVSPITSSYRYLLILLYVVMYMIDDLIIFGLAVLTINSAIGEKYAKWCKLIAGALLLLLGAILLFFPGVLASLG